MFFYFLLGGSMMKRNFLIGMLAIELGLGLVQAKRGNGTTRKEASL
jgi:hypothetical protein